MQSIQEFDFFPLTFDENGQLTSTAEFDALKQRAARASDVIYLAHGFRNDVTDATGLYTRFLTTFRSHFARPECGPLKGCDFAVAGVYWPSKVLPESFQPAEGSAQSFDDDAPVLADLKAKLKNLSELVPEAQAQLQRAIQLLPQVKNDGDAQNRFTDLVLSAAQDATPDPTEGLDKLRNQDGVTLLQKLSAPVILPTGAGSEFGRALGFDEGSAQGFVSGLASALGGVDRFINLTTWWIMKNRSGTVGAAGVAKSVRDLAISKPALKIHLVGHSLGGRLMAACAKSLAQEPKYQPASLTLLEAAFSHFGFSNDNGQRIPGFFRDVIAKRVVKGPLIATFSAQDSVVGTTYSLASRVALDNVRAIGDAADQYGGIGRNGAQKTAESTVAKLQKAGVSRYSLPLGVVNCLDGSGGLIKDHGDVTNEDVTYAFASVVVATQGGAAAGAG